MNWTAYKQRKAAWIAANPGATAQEYEQAAVREFRCVKSRKPSCGVAPQGEKRVLPAPGLRTQQADIA